MITRYICWTIALSVSLDIVLLQTPQRPHGPVIDGPSPVIGSPYQLNCTVTYNFGDWMTPIFSWSVNDELKTDKIHGSLLAAKSTDDSNVVTFPYSIKSLQCSDLLNKYTCQADVMTNGRTRIEMSLKKEKFNENYNNQTMTLEATSQCTWNNCSTCATTGFTGSIHRVDEEMTFECSKETTFHENVTNYFKWSIYGNAGWVLVRTTQLNTTDFNMNMNERNNGMCFSYEPRNDTMSYIPKKADPVRMKVKCIAEMHVYGKLNNSVEKVLDLCVLRRDTTPAPALHTTPAPALQSQINVGLMAGTVVGGVVLIANVVGIGYYIWHRKHSPRANAAVAPQPV